MQQVNGKNVQSSLFVVWTWFLVLKQLQGDLLMFDVEPEKAQCMWLMLNFIFDQIDVVEKVVMYQAYYSHLQIKALKNDF